MTSKTALQVILDQFPPLAGKSLLDIGCGRGGLAGPLRHAGALWHGLDPAIATAGDDIDCAPAEDMPYPDDSFDFAICVNALHHVPVAHMGAALDQAARVLRPRGQLLVIEPRAHGALSQVIAVVDDETDIRHAAQSAMDGCRSLRALRSFDYPRTETYDDFDAFCASLVQIAPERAPAIAARRADLAAAFAAHAQPVAKGPALAPRWALGQPMSARLFTPA